MQLQLYEEVCTRVNTLTSQNNAQWIFTMQKSGDCNVLEQTLLNTTEGKEMINKNVCMLGGESIPAYLLYNKVNMQIIL